jgi:hypothetical protein
VGGGDAKGFTALMLAARGGHAAACKVRERERERERERKKERARERAPHPVPGAAGVGRAF